MGFMRQDLDVIPHLDGLWRYARTLTRSNADADDLLQEALARAIRLSGSYDPSRPLIAWLVTIVRTTHFTASKRSAAERSRAATLAGLLRTDQRPAQEDRTDLSTVMSAFETLPGDQREVLHLVAVLGFTYADAAATLDVPVGTVMSRLSRARAALRSRLDLPEAAPSSSRLRVVGGRDGGT